MTVHGLVAEQARDRPDAVALVHSGTTVTYGALDAAADHLAAELADRGVGPGDIVPVLFPRGVPLVTAVLAVLKRGAAYAALDPGWPARRLDHLLHAIAPRVVIADTAVGGYPVLVPGPPEGATRTPEPVVVTADMACSVFFTSGSTGEPKGVVSPHGGTVRLFRDCTFARFHPGTVMPLAAAVPWDAFSLELWSVLMSGGTSVVIDEPYLSPVGLRAVVAEHGVDTLSLTASLFNLFVDEDLPCFAGLEQVFVGGEKVSAPHLRRFLDAHPSVRLVHCYGPVESTIFTTTHRVVRADCDRPDGVPIGRPVRDTAVIVWNGTAACEPGEVGELLIAGAGLALGYLGDPVLTAEKFPTLPLGGTTLRVYRTGDLAHVGPDGDLHFDGRADRQVKVHGHRVEPVETELAAARLPWIRDCTVLPVPGPGGGHRGLALFYRVDAAAPERADDELLGHLRQDLPHYLVPRWVRRVDGFPLNDNGKLDLRAMLALLPDAAQPTPPATGESTVEEIFAAVLGVGSVPPEKTLHELGGDSLDTARLATRLTAALGRPVPLSVVVRNPTVLSLTRWLREAAAPQAGPVLSGPVPLSPIQTFFWSRQQADPGGRMYNCCVAWWVDGPLDTDALALAMADLQQRHEALRARYHRPDPDGGPVADPAGRPAAPEVRASAGSADEAAALRHVLAVLDEPFDLGVGRIWRGATATSAATGRTLLGIAVHHVAFDGWSEAVLAAELGHCYTERLAGRPPAFPRPAPTLAELAARRRAELALVDLDQQRKYWQEQLRGIPDLAVPGPAAPDAEVLVHEYHLDAVAWERIGHAARREGTTPFTILLYRYATALRAVTGQPEFGVGVPIVRRGDEVTAAALGCLIDMLTVRIRLSTPDSGLAGVHHAVVDALANQDVPFVELVRMGGGTGTGRTPLHQTMFALQQNERPTLRLPGCGTEFVHLPRRHAPFELITEVWPQPDGGALVEITHRTDRVPSQIVDEVARRFLDPTGGVPQPAVQARMMRLLHGELVTQLLVVAAELGLADLLADGPRPVAELAQRCGAQPPALRRLLRALAGEGVFTETEPGTFGLTPLAATLRDGVPGSLRAWTRLWGLPERHRAIGALSHSVRTGQPAFEHLYGTDWWSHLAAAPEQAAMFNDAMGDLAREIHAATLERYDLSGVRRLVDVGGGHGHLVAAILRRYPDLTAVVLDRPAVLAGAGRTFAEPAIGDRVSLVGGDFFTAVPGGADAYLLSMILHDWDDDRSVTILRNIRDAMAPAARVIVVDAVLPAGDLPHDGKLRDAIMLALHPGRERTEVEFAELFAAAGLRHVRTVAVSASTGLLVAEAAE